MQLAAEDFANTRLGQRVGMQLDQFNYQLGASSYVREPGPSVGLDAGSKVHSKYPDGTVVMEGQQPGKITGPLNVQGNIVNEPHTVLQWDSMGGIYKAREYGYNSIPIRDIDFTHPTFPNGTLRPNHTAPEQHLYIPNDPNNPKAGFKRGPGQPL